MTRLVGVVKLGAGALDGLAARRAGPPPRPRHGRSMTEDIALTKKATSEARERNRRHRPNGEGKHRGKGEKEDDEARGHVDGLPRLAISGDSGPLPRLVKGAAFEDGTAGVGAMAASILQHW